MSNEDKGESRQGPSYRIEANHYLKTLVDAGATVKVSLLGATQNTITGELAGYDPYTLFVAQEGGNLIMIPKGAIRYVSPQGNVGG